MTKITTFSCIFPRSQLMTVGMLEYEGVGTANWMPHELERCESGTFQDIVLVLPYVISIFHVGRRQVNFKFILTFSSTSRMRYAIMAPETMEYDVIKLCVEERGNCSDA